MRTILLIPMLLVAAAARAPTLHAQVEAAAPADTAVQVAGTVVDARGRPVPGVNVFLRESLEGAVTDSAGRFSFPTTTRGAGVLLVRKIGLTAPELSVNLPLAEPLRVTMGSGVIVLDAVVATAGRYTAGGERGSQLSSLEVVVTPGAQGDIARALQALPGVQAVDEGSGLFVRGGDQTETRILLDGAPLLNPQQIEAPAGSAAPTVDPYLVTGIAFTTGGFGVRFGDALSAVLDLRTIGLPRARRSTVNASLGALSARTAQPISTGLPGNLGVHLTGTAGHSGAFLRLNGSNRSFSRDPQSHAFSGNLVWKPTAESEIKVFGIVRGGSFAVDVDEPSYTGVYDNRQSSGVYVATWRGLWGGLAPSAHLSRSEYTREEEQGAYRLRTRTSVDRAAAETAWEPAGWVVLRGGAELEHVSAQYTGRFPLYADQRGADAPTEAVDAARSGRRLGGYAEAEWRPLSRLRVTTGLRTDHSTLTERQSWDPRLSVSFLAGSGITVLAAGGVYHQVPEPLYFDPGVGGTPGIPAMRAVQMVVGAQAGSDQGGRFARLELYSKSYRDLAQLNREYTPLSGGTGRSRGLDVFLKGPVALGMDSRFSYSLVDADRTDPNTGMVARSPFDITQSMTLVLERSFKGMWRVAAAQRYATGRPYTGVLDASFDSERGSWVPRYGESMGERVPHFARLDVSVSRLHRFSPTMLGIVYASVTNLTGRENVFAYRYSSDYTERFPVRALFKRSIFFGASLTF
jgi:hypothetical protein